MADRSSSWRALVASSVLLAALSGGDASAQVLTWNGPTQGSQNLSPTPTPTLALTVPGTYTVTVDSGMVVTFRGAAGGGGGGLGTDRWCTPYHREKGGWQ
jgi:hypothetical protein